MFGRRQTTAMEYKPVPVNYTPVTRAADLIAGDLVTYNDGHSIITAGYRYHRGLPPGASEGRVRREAWGRRLRPVHAA